MSNKNTKNNNKKQDQEYYYRSAKQKVDQLRQFDNDSRATFAKKNYSNQMLSKNEKVPNNLKQSQLYPNKQQYKIAVNKFTSKQEQKSRRNTEGYENLPSGVRQYRNYQKNGSQDESEESVQSNNRQKSKLISIKKPKLTNKTEPITPNQAKTQKNQTTKAKDSPRANKFLFYQGSDAKNPLQNSKIKQKQVYPQQLNKKQDYRHHNQFLESQQQQYQYVYKKHVHQKGEDKKVRLKNKLGFIIDKANRDEDASVSYYSQSNSQRKHSEHSDNQEINRYRTQGKAKTIQISRPIRKVSIDPNKKGKQIQTKQMKQKVKPRQRRQRINKHQGSQKRQSSQQKQQKETQRAKQKGKQKQRQQKQQVNYKKIQNQKKKKQQNSRVMKKQEHKQKIDEDRIVESIEEKTSKKSRPSIKQQKDQFKKYIQSRKKNSQQRHQQSSSSVKQIIISKKAAQKNKNNQKKRTQQKEKQIQRRLLRQKQSDTQQEVNTYPQSHKKNEKAVQQQIKEQIKTSKFQIKLQKVQVEKPIIFNTKKLAKEKVNNISKKIDFQNEDTQASKNSARTHNRYKTQAQHVQSEDYLQDQLMDLIEKNDEYLGKARQEIKQSRYQGTKDKMFYKDDHVDLTKYHKQTPRRRLKTELNQRQQEDDRTLSQRQKTFLKLLKSKEQDLMRKLRQEMNNNPKGDSYEFKLQSPSRRGIKEVPFHDERENDTDRLNTRTKTYQISKMLPVLSTATTKPKAQIDSQQTPYRYYNMKHGRQFQTVANPIRQKTTSSMGNPQFSIKYRNKQLNNEIYRQKSSDLNDRQYRTQNINEKFKRLKRLMEKI